MSIKEALPHLRRAIESQLRIQELPVGIRENYNSDYTLLQAWMERWYRWTDEQFVPQPFELPSSKCRYLVNYGIFQDESDYHIHVCFCAGMLYVFRTGMGRWAIESGSYRLRTATQSGTRRITSEGYAIPWERIPGCVEIKIPRTILQSHDPGIDERNTSVKGKSAENICWEMMRLNLIPLEQVIISVTDFERQVQGSDFLLVSHTTKIQVKCDYRGGGSPDNSNTTGNLYLEVRESNPFGKH